MEQDLISGTIAAVVFQNHENGYAVIKLDCDEGGLITVVGTIPAPVAGERLIVTGKWSVHSSYGRQFEAEFLERMLPSSAAEILTYLSSRTVRGIGPKTAEKIVAQFKENSLKVLEQSPELLTEISGISMVKALEMGASFKKQVGIRRLIELLSVYHISAEFAVRAYRLFGPMTAELIQENPYLLTQNAIGGAFTSADAMALELGFEADDDRRVEAGVIFELRHNLNNGHTFLPADKLTEATAMLLDLDRWVISEAIDRLKEKEEVIADSVAGLRVIYLPEYFEAETYLAGRFVRMTLADEMRISHIDQKIEAIEQHHGIEYAELQKKAIRIAGERKLMILTGGPGTGKTTTLAGILALFEEIGYKTLLTAPTGRAAKRLSELTGRETTTIHRALEAQVSPETGDMFFLRDEDDPLNCDALIVDETSMVDVLLMHSLLRALPESASLILVGDPDQLPSVGAGNLFADLIRSGMIPTICLTEIFRQAKQSLIVMNAHAVNHGELPVLSARDKDFFFLKRRNTELTVQTIAELCARRLPENMGIAPGEIQVLSPTRKGETGTVNLNRVLQGVLNPPSRTKKERFWGENCFREGDRVMQIRNNYDILWKKVDGCAGSGIFNGDIGTILEINPQEDSIRISFDEREAVYDSDMLSELELAYAVTVHKSQGSEYRAVVFSVYGGPPMLLNRSVLYTGLTRARELLILVGNEEVVAQMTANNRKNRRYSGLRHRLMEFEE